MTSVTYRRGMPPDVLAPFLAVTPALSWWDIFWLFWVLQFAFYEGFWLLVDPAHTLSDTTWALEGLNRAHPYFYHWLPQHWAIALLVWGLFAWLSVHLPFGLAG